MRHDGNSTYDYRLGQTKQQQIRALQAAYAGDLSLPVTGAILVRDVDVTDLCSPEAHDLDALLERVASRLDDEDA